MYGLWLFKEIRTEYGYCKVDIYRKTFTGSAIEIGGFVGDSLSIALENLDTITAPVGKSVCSFAIYDTEQVEYDDLFSPDATAFKVVVSTRVGSGAYVTRWSGYVTPDFFAENLSYRTPISISARDNIGYLNDVDFDLTATTITVRELIQSAFTRIAEDYPMSLSFITQKQTAEGILAIDATISTTLLREMSWGEALETILHDLGLQMRWVDNNTIAVLDLSQIPEYYATQGFNFIDASGYREIAPAWRELSQEQNYGVRENFFEGWLREDNITFVKTENIRIPLSMGGVTGLVPMRYYTPNNWGVAGNTFVINPKDYVYFGTYGQMAQPFGERIFFTGVEKDATNIANNYMSYRQDVYASNRPMRITFKAFTSVMATGGIGNNDALLAYDPANRFMDFATGDTLQLGLKVNLLLHVGTRTYILGQNWEEINGAETNSLYFVLPKIGQVDGNSVTPNEEEITIDVNTIPNDGVLELRIYGFTIHNKTNLQEDAGSATYDWLRMVSYINEVKYTYNIDNPDTGRYSQVEVNKQHNIKDSQSYTFGQIPVEGGAVNAFAGGLFKADGNELIGFQRNADATNYNLLELVGRELIHFNKRNYNRLSGTIKNLNKEPLMFNRLFVREGKKYAPYNYSLNVISNEMNITSMQEVEPYTTANFSEVHSEVSIGGSTVSSGNNQILQYSAEVGNAKRLYELQTISENEKPDAYVLVDGAGYPEARKLKLTDIAGLDKEALEQYLVQYKYLQEADLAPIIQDFEKFEEAVSSLFGYFDATGNANNALKLGGQLPSYYATVDALNLVKNDVTAVSNRVQKFEDVIDIDDNGDVYIKGTRNFYTAGGTISMFGLGEGDSGEVASVSIKFEGSDVLYNPINGVITLPAYPSAGGGVADSVAWSNVTGKPNTLAGYGITDALSVNGGIISNSNWASQLTLNGDGTDAGLKFTNSGNFRGLLYTNNDGRLGWYDMIGVDNTLIHSGNIGSYNAGSANNLMINYTTSDKQYELLFTNPQTESVANIDAVYRDNNTKFAYNPYHKILYVERVQSKGVANDWNDTWSDGPWHGLAINGSNSLYDVVLTGYYGVTLKSSSGNISLTSGGNVLIGTTEDDGSKLKINGSITATEMIKTTSAIVTNFYSNATCGLYPNTWITNDGVNNRLWLYNDNNLALYGAHIELRSNTTVYGYISANTLYSNDWFRSYNATGWYNETYGGGIYMTDANYVRVYNGKGFWCDGDIISEGTVAMARLTSSSDAKLKDNIKWLSADRAIGVVRALRPTEWNWKKDHTHSFGFIAQDVQPIIPEMVSSVNDTLRLEYNQLHAFEIGAIQHIDSEVEILKRRVTELENELKQYRRNA